MLKQLRRVLAPPKRPLHAGGDWASVEATLGMSLPRDYKDFISVYGSGRIGKGLVIVNPFDWLYHHRMIRDAWVGWASFYPDIAVYGEVIPYPVFPESGGLLPFGNLGDVNILNWLTVGKPDSWPFVYYDREDGFIEIKGLSAVEFILEAVTQRSPLMIRTNSDSAFDPPCEFEADTEDPRFVGLICPQRLDLDQLTTQLAANWRSELVRIRKEPDRIRLLIEPLEGSIRLSQEGGDERTWLSLNYDSARENVAADVIRQLARMGFTEIERCPPPRVG